MSVSHGRGGMGCRLQHTTEVPLARRRRCTDYLWKTSPARRTAVPGAEPVPCDARLSRRRLRGVYCFGVRLPLRFAILLLALLVGQGSARADEVAAFAGQVADQRVLTIVESLGIQIVRRELPAQAGALAALDAAQSFPERVLLWIDHRAAMITVLRRSDGTALVRVLPPETFRTSPYVAALAAVELLSLIAQTPEAQVETTPVEPHAQRQPAAAPSLHWLLLAGGELAASPGKDPVLWRPVLGLGVERDLPYTPYFVLAQVSAAPLGVWTRDVPGASSQERVRYTRSDLAGRLGAGARVPAGSISGYLSGGVGFVSATPRGVPRARARVDRPQRGFAGAGAAFRYQPWHHVGFTFALDLTWLPTPTKYLVDGRTALEEGQLRVGSSLSLSVTLP